MSAPNLESIYIRSLNYDNTPQALDLKPGALSKLKSIQIESSWIKADVLASLIFASPNLETINLSGSDVGLPELTTTSGSYPLSNLKSIQLSNKYLDPNSLNKIFVFAPNLEIISMRNCRISYEVDPGEVASMAIPCLAKLKSIEVLGSSLYSESLQTLIQATPNLEDLILRGSSRLVDMQLRLSSGALPKLRTIEIDDTEISAQPVLALLCAASNLRSIKLHNCRKFAEQITAIKVAVQQKLSAHTDADWDFRMEGNNLDELQAHDVLYYSLPYMQKAIENNNVSYDMFSKVFKKIPFIADIQRKILSFLSPTMLHADQGCHRIKDLTDLFPSQKEMILSTVYQNFSPGYFSPGTTHEDREIANAFNDKLKGEFEKCRESLNLSA